jgi:AraC family transcriptional regulator
MISEHQPLSGVTINEAQSNVGRLFERQLPAGLRLALHTHDFFLLTVVTRGGFEERLSGIEQQCLPGDVRLLPAGDAHTNRVEASAECLQIEIAPPLLQTLTDIGGGFASSGRIGGALVGILGSRLVQECRQPDSCSELALEALTLDILSYAGRRRIPASVKRPPWLDRVHERINDGFTEKMSLAALADVADVHPVHVSREFHRWYGCTIGDLIRRLRLRHACQLMRNRDVSLGAIAVESGFADQSHFVMTFRRYLRTTPSRYRRWLMADVACRDFSSEH